MAKIGLNNFRYGILTENEDGTATYSVAKKPGKAISCNVEVENNDASLYADDGIAESDKSFNKATVTIGIDEDDQTTMAELLGHKIDEEKNEMVRNATDVAPYVGLGRVITKIVNGAYKYKVEFLNKVKFGEPSQEENTKGESTEFGTVEMEGTASQLANGDWSKSATFDTKEEAITYLEGLFTEA
jgi:phi13 family phage major tail protein